MLKIEDKIKNRVKKINLYDEILKIDNLGDRLKYLRKNYKSISMQEFCTCMNIPRSYEYLYENNEAVPKEERLIKFANFYDVDINILDLDKCNYITMNDLNMIMNIEDKTFDIAIRKNENISKLDKINFTLDECKIIIFIFSILNDDEKERYSNYIYDRIKELDINLTILNQRDNLKAEEQLIKNYFNILIEKIENYDENLNFDQLLEQINIYLLFSIIRHSMFYNSMNQQIFNNLLNKSKRIIKILYK